MSTQRHSKKEVAEAIKYAEDNGWRAEYGGKSHVCVTLLCPGGQGCCSPHFVNSTPQNLGNAAKRIKKAVDRCDYRAGEEEEEE